ASFSRSFHGISEDFRQWHFMHLIENSFEDFPSDAAKGLCLGMAKESAAWAIDSFLLSTAIDCTREVLLNTNDALERRNFLRSVIETSGSDLYSLDMLRRLEEGLKEQATGIPSGEENFRVAGFRTSKDQVALGVLSDLEEIKDYMSARLKK